MSKIRKYPDSVLNERAKEVDDFEGVGEIVERMFRIMVDNEGVGLAANQVGIASRIAIARVDEDEEPIIIVNPIVKSADGEDKMEEGCLSVPETVVEINRAENIVVRGLNPDGEEVEYRLSGLEARVIQHEIDHLNGVLIIDYLPRTELLKFQREYRKIREED